MWYLFFCPYKPNPLFVRFQGHIVIDHQNVSFIFYIYDSKQNK